MWAAARGEVQRQHAEERDQAALPLRAFLVNHVLPTLTKVGRGRGRGSS